MNVQQVNMNRRREWKSPCLPAPQPAYPTRDRATATGAARVVR